MLIVVVRRVARVALYGVWRLRVTHKLQKDVEACCACTGALKAAAEALGVLGGATLAVQTVVLGASLFQRHGSPAVQPPAASSMPGGSTTTAGGGRGLAQQPRVQIITPDAAGALGQERAKALFVSSRLPASQLLPSVPFILHPAQCLHNVKDSGRQLLIKEATTCRERQRCGRQQSHLERGEGGCGGYQGSRCGRR